MTDTRRYRVYFTDDAIRIPCHSMPQSYTGLCGLHDDMDSAIAAIPTEYQVIAEDLYPHNPHFGFVTECVLDSFEDDVMIYDMHNVFVSKYTPDASSEPATRARRHSGKRS